MSAKRYFYLLAILLFAFMGVNLTMWHSLTQKIFAQGDLTRMGNFIATESLTPRENYSSSHIEFSDYIKFGLHESFDIITIGDSFNNCGYQDYLSEKYGLKVLNFRIRNHCLEDLYILVQSGLLEEMRPKFIILESVGRSVQGRLGWNEIDIKRYTSYEFTFPDNDNKSETISSGFFAPVMFRANFNYVNNLLYRLFNPEKLSSEVYINTLDRNLFSNPNYENILLTFAGDFNYLHESANPEIINLNLNNAAKILNGKNIKLLFMPCVDKYDLYYPYIINKRGRPENDLFERIERETKNYIFVNTKKILREALARGEKDLYWFGDTHWSHLGYKLVCDELVREI